MKWHCNEQRGRRQSEQRLHVFLLQPCLFDCWFGYATPPYTRSYGRRHLFPLTAPGSATAQATSCQANTSDYGVPSSRVADAYAVNLLLDRVILTGIDPPTGAAGMSVRLQGGHFPPAPVMVRFENQANHAVQTAMSIPSDRPRGTVVTVPSGLPAGTYNVGIMQAGLPDPVSQTVQFTVP